MKRTDKQIEYYADWLKNLSLIILPASSADAILNGNRLLLDAFGIIVGLACVWLGGTLTGKLKEDRIST